MSFVKVGNKKYRYNKYLVCGINVEGKEIKFKYETFDDLITRLMDLDILIGQKLKSEYDDWVKVRRDPIDGSMKFYFKDEEESWKSKLFLDGFDLRWKGRKYIKEKFFKTKLFDLIKEKNAIFTFLKHNPHPEWKKIFNSYSPFYKN